jgi:hypothetical protein
LLLLLLLCVWGEWWMGGYQNEGHADVVRGRLVGCRFNPTNVALDQVASVTAIALLNRFAPRLLLQVTVQAASGERLGRSKVPIWNGVDSVRVRLRTESAALGSRFAARGFAPCLFARELSGGFVPLCACWHS